MIGLINLRYNLYTLLINLKYNLYTFRYRIFFKIRSSYSEEFSIAANGPSLHSTVTRSTFRKDSLL